MTRRQRQAARIGAWTGVILTLGIVALHAGGRLDWLELATLDWRFQYANAADSCGRIICLDITDRDLETVGRWPWPRDRQAPLISIPAELGATSILVDLQWNEPETVRTATVGDPDVRATPTQLERDALTELIFPDLTLRDAITAAGNVHLAFAYDSDDPTRTPHFVRALRGKLPAQSNRERIAAALFHDPGQTPDQLTAALAPRIAADQVDRDFGTCLDAALRERLRDWLSIDDTLWDTPPTQTFEPAYTAIFGDTPEGTNPRMSALARAFREVLGVAATREKAKTGIGRDLFFDNPLLRVEGYIPVYYLHARAARDVGFVNFEPDTDGAVRSVALFRTTDEYEPPLAHLAFGVACHELGLTTEDVSLRLGKIHLNQPNSAKPALSIPLDRHGRMLIPWLPTRNWLEQFDHLPANSVLGLHELRLARRHNESLRVDALRALFTTPEISRFNRYVQMLDDLAALPAMIKQLDDVGDADGAAFLRDQQAALQDEIARGERVLRELLRAGTDAADLASEQMRTKLGERFAELDHIREVNARLDTQIDALVKRLRPHFADRVCLVGYTATALADMVPIPTHPRAPGVIAHANLINGLLTGRVIGWAPAWFNVLLMLVCGLLSTIVAVRYRPRTGAMLLATAVVALLVVAGWSAFRLAGVWVAIVAPLLALVLPYAAITLYLFIFIDRERRQLATALGQYTSPEIARQVAEDPELCQRAESREVTTIFTDLRGFTGISEQIGAARTQQVLNVCLGRFTDVMLRHEAMVNKFIGDGIFAFWNPVIYPQPDHAHRGVETAIDLQTALAAMIREQSSGDEAFRELFLRIGLATGRAVVGPCGSEQKYDYTCIGDSVNVAARLESANKFYGTSILVSGATREQAGDDFAYRSLGRVQVKGKRQGVPIFEVLGRRADVEAERLRRAEQFEEGIDAFQSRQWGAAERVFAKLIESNAADRAAEQYLLAARTLRASPPPDDWSGALELREK